MKKLMRKDEKSKGFGHESPQKTFFRGLFGLFRSDLRRLAAAPPAELDGSRLDQSRGLAPAARALQPKAQSVREDFFIQRIKFLLSHENRNSYDFLKI